MKYFLVLLLSLSLFADDIESDTNKKTSTEIKIIKPISVPNIKYIKGMEDYSLFDVTKEGLKSFIEKKKINKLTLETMYNRIDNPTSIIVSAYAYDYGYQRPDLAENFYKLFTDKFGFENKLRYADFLIRTGRASEIENLFDKMDCVVNFKNATECKYYRGLATYLVTGDNKNKDLKSIRKKLPKAEEIFSSN